MNFGIGEKEVILYVNYWLLLLFLLYGRVLFCIKININIKKSVVSRLNYIFKYWFFLLCIVDIIKNSKDFGKKLNEI